jgi:solute carrier family 35, member E1
MFMIKSSSIATCSGSLRLTKGSNSNRKPNRVVVQSLNSSTLNNTSKPILSLKPLYISAERSINSSAQSQPILRDLRCKALHKDEEEKPPASSAAQKVKIGTYFATWWALNVVFNIYNKKVLNAFPYPWLTSTLSLAMGSLIMLVSWGTRIAETPKTDFDFWKALAPVRFGSLSNSFFFFVFAFFSLFDLVKLG